MFTELSDADYEISDRIQEALEAAREGLTPSRVARRVGVSTDKAREILRWMVTRQFAHTSGNGAWTRYHAGRA